MPNRHPNIIVGVTKSLIMKKLIALGFLILTVSAMGQQKVGENRSGTFVITANLNLLKPRWNEIVGETVSDYRIISSTNDGAQWYYLVGTSSSGTKVATTLAYEGNNFVMPDQALASSSTCKCTGCGFTGCDPRWMKALKKWICDDPCVRCQKTVTATNLTLWSD